VFVDVENVVDSEFDGVDVGDDLLELVRGSAAFGEVVHFGRRRRRRSASAGVVLVVVLMMLVSSLGRVGVVTVARVVVAAAV
jgi:hypothetical protein